MAVISDTDVTQICSHLLRCDTTNYAHGQAKGESACVDYIESLLESTRFERVRLNSARGRSNLVVTVPGRDPSAAGVVCHGHLDVVPADPTQWSFDPFSGAVVDGSVRGRGAVDMKDFVSAMIRTLLDWAQEGYQPLHTTVFAFVADEETDGAFGAAWLVARHPDLFTGVRYALGESGGMRVPWTDAAGKPVNFYPVAVAERGTCHMRVTAHGPSGHGSYARDDNAVLRLTDALGRIGHHVWPVEVTRTMREFLDVVNRVRGVDILEGIDMQSHDGLARLLKALGPLGSIVSRAFRPSAVPTMLKAGYKVNVIPEQAQGCLDVRTLPGDEDDVLQQIDALLGPHVDRTFIAHEPALESAFDGPFYLGVCKAVRHIDPDAVPIPFCTGGGTDAKAFSTLGITGYGFSPSCPGPQGQIAQGAHGVDEQVPVASLAFAHDVLRTILETPW